MYPSYKKRIFINQRNRIYPIQIYVLKTQGDFILLYYLSLLKYAVPMTFFKIFTEYLQVQKIFFILGTMLLLTACKEASDKNIGQTEITKWQGGKKSAISITYDDGIISQFTVARPIMNKLNIPATYFVLTGKIEGAQQGKFIGRTQNDIIQETATTKTNADNLFERASLIAYTGISEADAYHAEAGSLFESGKVQEAYKKIDTAYEKWRAGTLQDTDNVVYHNNVQDTTSWDDLRRYAEEGHEIASHTITHPRLAVLDEINLRYELEQSQADISKHLGEKYTFSAECPYGTEDERVMEAAYQVYPALRNRMPETWLEELNRSSDIDPITSEKEYVQWQRGPLTNTSMDLMKSWVDDCLTRDNIWLVLVFHGVDDFGWEAKTAEELEEYFSYIKQREDDLWVATFADVTKYIRERKNIEISNTIKDNTIEVNLSSTLDPEIYDVPVTLKTYVPNNWKNIVLKEIAVQSNQSELNIEKDAYGTYVEYTVSPGISQLVLVGEL